jgi:hypothetical protein
MLCHIYRRGEFYGSSNVAADVCRIDRKRLFKALSTLQEKGLITKQSRKGQTSVYVVTPDPKTEQVKIEPVPKTEQDVTRKRNTHLTRKRNTKVIPSKGNPIKVIEPDVSLPFISDQFKETWNDWIQHRIQKKKKLTQISQSRQLKKLASWGEDRAIAAINLSIEKNWEGIFEPKPESRPTTEKTTYQKNGIQYRPFD